MTPNKIIVDLEAIRHNFFELKRLAGPGVGTIPVIKSDAYGHGMIAVAKCLEPERPDYFAVFEPAEALELRQAGCRTPVLVMMGLESRDIPAVIEADLTVALFDQALARELSKTASRKGRVVPVHLKVDTGMTRLGVPWHAVSSFLQPLVDLPGIRLEGMFSHFAASDEPAHAFTDEQMERFLTAVDQAKALGVCTAAVHVANSGGVLNAAARHCGLIRPGIALYGSSPGARLDMQCRLKPAMTFKSRVIQVRTVPAGTPVSYGSTYVTPEPATLATIPVGYDDGYFRSLSNKGRVLIHGKGVPIVGRVCMNLTVVDVSGLDRVCAGDEVVLLGSQGPERITAEEIADRTETISYEVYCSLGKANPREYVPAAACAPNRPRR